MENEKKKLSDLAYTITVDNYDKAFGEVQKRFEFPRNIVFTVLVALVAAYNLYMAIKVPTNNNTQVMIVGVSIAFLLILWITPLKRRKTLKEALSTIEDDSYTAEVFEDSIKITTVVKPDEEGNIPEIAPKIIFYETDEPYVMEIPDEFVIYIKKQMFYVIPKKYLSDEQTELLRKELSEKSKKFYNQK